MSKKNETKPLKQPAVRRSVTITIPLDIAETLHALIDGSIGTSDDDEFNRQMMPIRDKLERRINKHYA
jgi:hypothetical protein